MEKFEDRFVEHLWAWTAAIFVGVMVFSRKGFLEVFVEPFYWYTPLIWILGTAALIFGCAVAGCIPAMATSFVSARVQDWSWSKSQKIIYPIGLFLIALASAVLFFRFPS